MIGMRQTIQSLLLTLATAAMILSAACGGRSEERADENIASPTVTAPDEGEVAQRVPVPSPVQEWLWSGLTIEQARELVPFPVAVPDPIPDRLSLTNVTVAKVPPTTATTSPNQVVLYFSDPETATKVQLEETTLRREVAIGPSASQSTIEINGQSITKIVEPRSSGQTIVTYLWNQRDLWFVLASLTTSAETEQRLEKLIASIRFLG